MPRVWDSYLTDVDRAIYEQYDVTHHRFERPVLVVVDVYNSAFGDQPGTVLEHRARFPQSCGEYAWAALPHLVRLVEAARTSDVPIVYLTRQPGFPSTKRKVTRPVDPWDYEIVAPIKPRPEDIVLKKPQASGFYATMLDRVLNELNRNQLWVCGESTSGCVRATVVDAAFRGYQVQVIEEATFDRTPASHAMNLFDMHHKYADVVSLATILEDVAALS